MIGILAEDAVAAQTSFGGTNKRGPDGCWCRWIFTSSLKITFHEHVCLGISSSWVALCRVHYPLKSDSCNIMPSRGWESMGLPSWQVSEHVAPPGSPTLPKIYTIFFYPWRPWASHLGVHRMRGTNFLNFLFNLYIYFLCSLSPTLYCND